MVRNRASVVLALAAVLVVRLASTAVSKQTAPPHTVLTIHWGSASFPANPLLEEGIRHSLTLRPDLGIDYFAEYLESDRFQDERVSAAFADYLREKYRGRRIDLVIAVTDPAVRFAIRLRDTLFPDAPIVTAVSGPPDDATRREGAGLTGVVLDVARGETLDLALRLHPSTQEVLVVVKSADERRFETVRAELQRFASRVGLTYITEDTVAGMIARIKAAPSRSLILYVWQGQDEPGHLLYPDQVAQLVADASQVPVYASNDLYVGKGAIGGVVRTNAVTGRRLGEIAVRILDGTAAQDIPFEAAQLRPVFDARAMKRWGVDERQLPAGSIVAFREPSLWRDYRREVLTALAGIALQSLLIIGLLYQRRARRKAEVESRNSLALAADATRRVTMSVLTGSLAHELVQPLSSILHNAQAGEMLMDSDRATPETMREILSEIHTADDHATQIIERHRTMLRSRQLKTKPIDIHTVVRQSLALVAHDARTRQVQVEAALPSAPCVVAGDSVLLQQVFVNLVMNAMEAMAETPRDRRCVTVLSNLTGGRVEVSVRDAGSGLPANVNGRLFEAFVTTKTNGTGIGLTIARSIAEAHGGRLEAHNNPQGGATFTLTLPCVVETDHAKSSAVVPLS